jgi:organic hydroperoxide reductase OsmC/OhrA
MNFLVKGVEREVHHSLQRNRDEVVSNAYAFDTRLCNTAALAARPQNRQLFSPGGTTIVSRTNVSIAHERLSTPEVYIMSDTSSRKNMHDYKAHLIWDGNLGTGTTTYTGYGRKYRLLIDGKPELTGSADPMFKGDANVYNPEDLFVAALSSCHLLSYLALCARTKINVIAYEDNASGVLKLLPNGGGIFESVTLRPVVTLAPGSDEKRALELHETAQDLCFIAASVKIPVLHEPQIRVEGAETSARPAHKSTDLESRA